MMAPSIATLLTSLFLLVPTCFSWQIARGAAQPTRSSLSSSSDTSDIRVLADDDSASSTSRRSILLHSPLLALTTTFTLPTLAANAAPENPAPNLQFTTSPTGLQYADVKTGSSSVPSPTNGQVVSIDYVMSTTGARYGSKIYSTKDAGAPYRWTLGDGKTIPGLEEAVRGMNPGGIRRLIIPSKLAYQASSGTIREECESGKGLGPIPPATEALGEFQRFKNIYCNPDRVYQPDLVMDVKLYGGKR
ncbi:hypothetical protein ACHAXR_000859 [Thalassiosira sp. AJA248-18]